MQLYIRYYQVLWQWTRCLSGTEGINNVLPTTAPPIYIPTPRSAYRRSGNIKYICAYIVTTCKYIYIIYLQPTLYSLAKLLLVDFPSNSTDEKKKGRRGKGFIWTPATKYLLINIGILFFQNYYYYSFFIFQTTATCLNRNHRITRYIHVQHAANVYCHGQVDLIGSRRSVIPHICAVLKRPDETSVQVPDKLYIHTYIDIRRPGRNVKGEGEWGDKVSEQVFTLSYEQISPINMKI